MKIKLFNYVGLIALFLTLSSPFGYAESMDELIDSLDKQYEELVPAPYSSVNTDYKLSQVALGSLYTTKALNLLYKQNQEISKKYDTLIQKYDKVIDQNDEIIRLLTVISEKEKGVRTNKEPSGD